MFSGGLITISSRSHGRNILFVTASFANMIPCDISVGTIRSGWCRQPLLPFFWLSPSAKSGREPLHSTVMLCSAQDPEESLRRIFSRSSLSERGPMSPQWPTGSLASWKGYHLVSLDFCASHIHKLIDDFVCFFDKYPKRLASPLKRTRQLGISLVVPIDW